MRRAKLTLLLTFTLSLALASRIAAQQAGAGGVLPAFEVATIKPPDPAAQYQKMGFYGDVGGRVFLGGDVKMLIMYAFGLQDYQLVGGPDWTRSQRFEISAVPPDASLSRNIKIRNADPTPEQRLMLQSLMLDRFGLKYHFETRLGEVFLLTRGGKPLQLKPPKDAASDPRAIVMMKQGGIVDGQAMGNNTTMEYLALRLSQYLQLPVVNQTAVTGAYDFHLPADEPENHDMVAAVLDVVERLGLKIKRDRGSIQTLVIDHVEQPSEN